MFDWHQSVPEFDQMKFSAPDQCKLNGKVAAGFDFPPFCGGRLWQHLRHLRTVVVSADLGCHSFIASLSNGAMESFHAEPSHVEFPRQLSTKSKTTRRDIPLIPS
jgi:hypothetical protein